MKKALNTILIVVVGLLAFVACSPQSSVSDELVSATLISTDRVTRALETEVNFDLSAVKLWKYTARKANGGLTTGQTELGKDNAVALSADGTTQGLSQGAWNFVLYGYDAAEEGNLIAQGSINNATVTTKNNTVTITVYPQQTEGAKGKLVISDDVSIMSADGKTTYTSGNQGYTMSYSVYKSEDTEMETAVTNLNSLDVGSYKVVITFKGTVNEEEYDAATASTTVNVYAGLTTTVKGTVGETKQAATLSKKPGVYTGTAKKEKVDSSTIAAAITMEANASPVGTTKKTSVKFPANSLSLNSSELNLTIVASPVETVTSTYTVVDNESAVAGFDLTLEGATINTLSENNGIEITTTIATGLDKDNLNIKYVGDSNDTTAQITEYNSSTGALTFKVYHFSEYVITTTENVAYDEASLRKEISKATAETTRGIKIIEDIFLEESVKIEDAKKVKINLNGHNIECPYNYTFVIQNANVEFTGKGEIITNRTAHDPSQAVRLIGSEQSNAENYSVATIGQDVTLRGFYGIMVARVAGQTYSYGVVVNMNGKFIGDNLSEDQPAIVYTNGNIKATDGKVPEINLTGAKTDNGSIYAAGYAKWSIKDCSITSSNALSLKSGTFTIDGGTYTSTGEFYDPSTDTSNGSVETGAALSMTSNDGYAKKLDVTVSNGTFISNNGYAVFEGIPNKTENGNLVYEQDGTTPKKAADESYVTLKINGGTFTGNSEKGAIKLSTIKDKKVITSGNFNSDPKDYLADNCSASETSGTWTVSSGADSQT